MTMNKHNWKVIKGFIVTPIILSFIFAFSLSVLALFSESEYGRAELFFVGIMGWFVHALPFAIIIIVVAGIPGYLYLNRSGYNEQRHYLITGLVVGFMLPLLALLIMNPFEWWIYFMSAIFGVLAAFFFWHLSIKPQQINRP